MEETVDHVLASRRFRGGRRGLTAGLAVAAVLHAAAFLAVLLMPAPPPPKFEIVSVQVVPAQALGRPRPPARAAEPPPAPLPEPEPAPPQRPEPEVAPLPSPEPRQRPPETPRSEPRPPAATAGGPDAAGAGEEREGSPRGSALGLSAFGAEIAGIDPDFRYDYYIERMLSSIRSQWVRPPAEGEIRAVVHFRIQRSGEVTDLDVRESSGLPAFDLAALRAVRNAAPLPRLPASYRRDSLGVTLIVR